jgi:hypothetical protein
MDQIEIEGIADWLRRDGETLEHAVRRASLRLRVADQGSLLRDGRLGRTAEGWTIYVRRGIDKKRRAWAIAHELAEWALRTTIDQRIEELAHSIAAAILAPRGVVVSLYRQPRDIAHLARACSVTETCAALRVGEVVDPTAVLTPTIARVRAPREFVWPAEPQLRRMARSDAPGLARIKLKDGPNRVALIAA